MPTIALVDDDRNILTSVSIALEAEGYRTTTYADGASALDGFKSSPPDLAILDIKMPRMDGMETLRRLRQKSDMPVIFLTSKDEEIDELFGLKMGADSLESFIRGPPHASPSNTQGGSRVPELGSLGSVRGAPSNGRPYRDYGQPRSRSPQLHRFFVKSTSNRVS